MIAVNSFSRLLIVAVVLSAIGCDNNSNNSNPNDPSQVNIQFTVTDLVVGTGNPAVVGNVATVNYTGWLYNGGGPESKGRQFDTSMQPGRNPETITIGRLQFIPGFEQALLGMRVGGKRRAYVPSDLAYGPQGAGNGVIPPNAALVFEIDLVSLVQQ
jgi:FKBP-type peptidyl-prolyl cis-trans isomerase FkpA